ncbi:MAG: GIY-YIG nuclease family protein [Emcibacteraceae bacterium]|jgi:putative endonuclease|nr:GIY-YIG nuclease family protein [Kordiimonadaceae bacterium]MDG1020773.1 GIY-YIG nuclease family protein [Emcibacteraceae bacterium]MDG1727185.1 GIY-YIG nuclease family protein [Emcibacteraceae bacterium]
MSTWTLYILKCNDHSLYTGITNNLEKRVSDHEVGIGAKYTRGRGPFEIVYQEKFQDRSSASKREFAVKKLSKLEKQKLIKK